MCITIRDVTINIFNPELKIGFGDIRNAWLLEGRNPFKPSAQVRGILVYRLQGSGKQVVSQVKGGLLIKKILFKIEVPILSLKLH